MNQSSPTPICFKTGRCFSYSRSAVPFRKAVDVQIDLVDRLISGPRRPGNGLVVSGPSSISGVPRGVCAWARTRRRRGSGKRPPGKQRRSAQPHALSSPGTDPRNPFGAGRMTWVSSSSSRGRQRRTRTSTRSRYQREADSRPDAALTTRYFRYCGWGGCPARDSLEQGHAAGERRIGGRGAVSATGRDMAGSFAVRWVSCAPAGHSRFSPPSPHPNKT